jgi:hypothetical protein
VRDQVVHVQVIIHSYLRRVQRDQVIILLHQLLIAAKVAFQVHHVQRDQVELVLQVIAQVDHVQPEIAEHVQPEIADHVQPVIAQVVSADLVVIVLPAVVSADLVRPEPVVIVQVVLRQVQVHQLVVRREHVQVGVQVQLVVAVKLPVRLVRVAESLQRVASLNAQSVKSSTT